MNHLSGTTTDLYSIMLVLNTASNLNTVSVTFAVRRLVMISKTNSITTDMAGITH